MADSPTVQRYTERQEKFGRFFIKNVARLQVWIYRLSGGRLANTFTHGAPVALLTTIGRLSGRKRTVPVLFLERGDDVVVVASQGGMSTHLVWYRNLTADPSVEVQIGSRRRAMSARYASADEEARLWPPLIEMYPDFIAYRARAEGVRKIPVMILEPVG